LKYTRYAGGKILEPHYHNIIHSIPNKPKYFGYVAWMGFNRRVKICEAGIIHKFYEVNFLTGEIETTVYNFVPCLKVIPGGPSGKLLIFKKC